MALPGIVRWEEVSAGRIIASRYRLLYELGRGGMGAVWLAEHLALRVHVAIKLIDASLAASKDAVRRFEREARAAASLRSPHVVQVLDFGVEAGTPYLAMEYLIGESLGARLKRGKLTPQEVWQVMNQAGRAMTKAHAAGYIHRDLKPDNVFLVEDDPEFFVKVLDFGLAKALEESPSTRSLTRSGTVIGTPRHMSPEQAVGGVVDSRSDLWSLGVIAFESLIGFLPFDGKTIPALLRAICFDPIVIPSRVAAVPKGFDAWFARAACRDPEKRFQTAKEMMDELEPILSKAAPPVLSSVPAPPPEPELELADNEVTLRMVTSAAARSQDRRSDERMPSSIPAAINGQRDLRHTGLIRNASRTGALLSTRHRCYPDETMLLTLFVHGPQKGIVVQAKVVRVMVRSGGSMWRFDVGVMFDPPLREDVIDQLARRTSQSGT